MNAAKTDVRDGASKGATHDGSSKGLRIGLWVVQVLLALAFAFSGAMKLTVPYAELA
jgi:hypothetical protein